MTITQDKIPKRERKYQRQSTTITQEKIPKRDKESAKGCLNSRKNHYYKMLRIQIWSKEKDVIKSFFQNEKCKKET